jgi:hypothetical protein
MGTLGSLYLGLHLTNVCGSFVLDQWSRYSPLKGFSVPFKYVWSEKVEKQPIFLLFCRTKEDLFLLPRCHSYQSADEE